MIGAGGLNQALSVSYSDNTNAGTATASASYGGDANHKPSSDSKTFAIEQAEPTVSISWADPQTFDGDPHPATRLGERGRLAFRGSREPRLHLLQRPERDWDAAGGCADRCRHLHRRGGLCRQWQLQAGVGQKTIAIEKASSTTVVTCPASVTYTGSAQEPCSANVTGAGGLAESVTVSYSDNTNAGTATASASYGGDANHKPSGDSKTFAIEKAEASVTITWADPQTYDGDPHPASAVVDGVGGETDLAPPAELTYYSGPNATGTPLAGAPTEAGTYTVEADFAGNGNYKPASAEKTIAIEKASSTTVVTCPASVTYTGSAQEPCSANVTGAGGLDESVTVTYSDNTNAGTATASASYGGDANHKPSGHSKTFTIDKADSTTTVTCPVSVTYTGSGQEPCTAKVTGAGGLNQSLSVNYSSNTDAGTATANAGYAGDANHKASDDSKTFTIEKAGSTTTVTCPAAVTYDGSAQKPCTAKVTGAGGLDQSLPVSYSDNTNAGTATASAGFGGDANHTSSGDSTTFTIEKADSTTTVSCPASVTFNGSAQEPCSANVDGRGRAGRFRDSQLLG